MTSAFGRAPSRSFFRFHSAPAVIPAPVPPERPTPVLRCPQDIVSRARSGRVRFPGSRSPPRRNDRRRAMGRNGLVAGAHVIGAVGKTVTTSSSAGIWASRSGSIGASRTLLAVTSTARISSVFSSTPKWILRREPSHGYAARRQSFLTIEARQAR